MLDRESLLGPLPWGIFSHVTIRAEQEGIPEEGGNEKGFSFQHGKSMTTNERSRSITYWREFVDAVAVKAIHEVNASSAEKYRIFLESQRLMEKTKRSKVMKLQTILKYARPRNKPHTLDIESVKSDLRLLIELPKLPAGNPKPIKPRHFHAMLKVASTKWKAMLLLALNSALHPKELADA